VWDKTIFKSIHRLVGGNLKFIVTGGASIASDVKYFSCVVYGCPVFEGYKFFEYFFIKLPIYEQGLIPNNFKWTNGMCCRRNFNYHI
jgi:hypothetical protein